MSDQPDLHAGFECLARWLDAIRSDLDAASQTLYVSWRGEHSDFVRFNHGQVRQAGTVAREGASLRLVAGRRSVVLSVGLGGGLGGRIEGGPGGLGAAGGRDVAAILDAALVQLRLDLLGAEEDPYLLMDESPRHSEVGEGSRMPPPQALARTVGQAAREAARHDPAGIDLVGFHQGGRFARGMLSSLGHRHYHEAGDWRFDYSLYSRHPGCGDKAVKAEVGARHWAPEQLLASVDASARQVPVLARPPRRLVPGDYRVALAPAACGELLGMIAGAFSARDLRTGASALQRLADGRASLDPRVRLDEDLGRAGVALFQDEGFERPACTSLVAEGQLTGRLISPRTAQEFSLASNGANDWESAQGLTLGAGDLPDEALWARLGTGLAISNLWYLNYSDRDDARITGMTRFATLWVEDGEPVAPIEVMRFDDSVYRLLGSELEALGSTVHWLASGDTYDWRGPGGVGTPCALIRAMRLTL